QSLRSRTKYGTSGSATRLQRKSPPVPLPIYCVYSTKERLYCHRASGSSDSSQLSSSRDGHHSDNMFYPQYVMEDGSNSSASSRFAPNTYDESTDDDAEYAVPPDAIELRNSSSDLKCVLQKEELCNGIVNSVSTSFIVHRSLILCY
ncbi:unnamed protein product, partial [Soboliphyme baturini]|uniref:Ovule protein n=1 Tax=Soboliphyme baturini TaxID=241478 RepID=A0A183J9F1_9BILA